MSLGSVLGKIEQLRKTTKRTEKTTLLKSYLEDELFLKVVQFALDSRKHYSISAAEFPEYKPSYDTYDVDTLFTYLNYLANKRGCTNFEKEELHRIACSDRLLYDITQLILSKNLKCGCGDKTINDARPDTVEIFPYMRCSTISKIGNIQYPAIIQEKLNGEYISIIVDENKKVVHRTRNGSFLDLKGRFVRQFTAEDNIYNCVYTGEILVVDENGKYLTREASNGIISKAISGTLSEEEADRIVVVLWDVIGLPEFYETTTIPEKERATYLTRFDILKNFILDKKPDNVKLVNYKIVTSFDEAIEFYNMLVEMGLEGAVLKDFRLIFKNTTSVLQIKVKPVKTCELRIIAWSYGAKGQKYEYCLGSITCQSECGIVVVDCGSGFNDKDRGFLGFDENGNVIVGMDKEAKIRWNNNIQKLAELNFSELCRDKKYPDKWSLYLPIYKGIRDDKNVADDYEYIKSL